MTSHRVCRRSLHAAVLLLLSAAEVCRASDELPVGPRAIAMGNTFTAIADDATAIYWNPAGLPWIGNQELAGTHANLFGTGVKDDYLAFLLPVAPAHALAADWYHSGLDDGELTFGENRFDLAYGAKFWNRASVGVSVKYLTRNTGLDQVEVRNGDGFGIDAGILLAPLDRLRLGCSMRNLTDTRVSYSNTTGSTVLYEQKIRVGAAYRVLPRGIVAMDVDDRIHVGAEYAPLEPITLRGGLEQDLEDTGEGLSYAIGAGVKAGIFRFDYALSVHPTLGETNNFGLSLAFNFNPSRVRIEKVDVEDVYSSLQKTYAQESFGTARIRNLDDRPLTAKVSVFSPGLMDEPTEKEVVLRPKVSQDIPLTAVFSDKIISSAGDRRVQLTVGVSYSNQRLPRTEHRTTDLVAYGPGAIEWGRGAMQAAAFVTSRDPVVLDFAREACRPIAAAPKSLFGNRNVDFAAAIVDALDTLGMVYLPDPNSPFKASSQTPGAVDTIYYPRETLAKRTGDCDDTTVLLSALLESVGVPTCLVDAPGHLFLMIGTGIHERNRIAMRIPQDLYAIHDEQVWIPIETTVMDRGFAEAWQEGAKAYTDWVARDRLALVDVAAAQTRYEPVVLPDPGEAGRPGVDPNSLAALVGGDAATVAGWRSDYFADRFGGLNTKLEASPAALNEIAYVYYVSGEFDEAHRALEQALGEDPNSPRTRNNLANVLIMKGDVPAALKEYETATEAAPEDGGILLNAGLVRYVSGDTAQAARDLARALELGEGYDQARRLLGLAPDENSNREGKQKLSESEIRELLKEALARVPARQAAPDSSVAPAKSAKRKTPDYRIAAARSAPDQALVLGNFLYWKQ